MSDPSSQLGFPLPRAPLCQVDKAEQPCHPHSTSSHRGGDRSRTEFGNTETSWAVEGDRWEKVLAANPNYLGKPGLTGGKKELTPARSPLTFTRVPGYTRLREVNKTNK